MDFASINQGIISEESAYIDLKTELDDVLKNMVDPILADFRADFVKQYNSLTTTFQNVSLFQRQINDLQEKLKRNLRNKNETTKAVYDDEERLKNLNQDYEKVYLQIDDKKFEEIEKEKEIRGLNEEIIKLRTRLDVENLSNFKPQELESQQKLVSEQDEIETRLIILEERKNVEFERSNQLTKLKMEAERYGEQLTQEIKALDEEKALYLQKLEDEKRKKGEIENNLQQCIKSNRSIKDELTTKDEVKASMIAKNKENMIDKERLTKIHKEEIENREKKSKENEEIIKKIYDLEERINEIRKENKEKEEEIRKKEKELKEFRKEKNIFEKEIQKLEAEMENIQQNTEIFNEERKKIRNQLKDLEKELEERHTESVQKKTELAKKLKGKDEKMKELEKLQNEIDELYNKHIAMQNSNQRMANENSGIKKEIEQLENEKNNVEREKNMYAKQASDANMEYTQALERLKNLDEAINELKTKNNQAETKLKQQKKIYEALRADCNRFAKKYQDAQYEIKEIMEDNIKKQQKYQFLKVELSSRQGEFQKKIKSLETEEEDYKTNETNKKSLTDQLSSTKISIVKYQEMNNNLKKTIANAEIDFQKQEKEHQIVVNERDFMGQQLIKRNEEIQSLYEKIKVLQSELSKMHSQYAKKLLELEKAKGEREFLLEEYTKTQNIIKNIMDLKVIKIRLEKELLITKNKVRSLEDENKKPMNIHRWRKLEYSDPEKFELITQINSLQKRLIAKTEEVGQKEDLIQEKEKLYIKLKTIVARQSGVDMAEALKNYKKIIVEKTAALKKLVEDIKNHQSTIRIYQVENKRLDGELDKLKEAWFERVKQNNMEANNNNMMMYNLDEENNENAENGDGNEGGNHSNLFSPNQGIHRGGNSA